MSDRRYLHAMCADGAMRHDLDGNPTEPISDEHRDGARAALAELAAKRAQPMAQRPQRKQSAMAENSNSSPREIT